MVGCWCVVVWFLHVVELIRVKCGLEDEEGVFMKEVDLLKNTHCESKPGSIGMHTVSKAWLTPEKAVHSRKHIWPMP